jgi:hypothetical protein
VEEGQCQCAKRLESSGAFRSECAADPEALEVLAWTGDDHLLCAAPCHRKLARVLPPARAQVPAHVHASSERQSSGVYYHEHTRWLATAHRFALLHVHAHLQQAVVRRVAVVVVVVVVAAAAAAVAETECPLSRR